MDNSDQKSAPPIVSMAPLSFEPLLDSDELQSYAWHEVPYCC